MKLLLLTLILSITSFMGLETASAQATCGVSNATCEFYSCMEREMNCGPQGYFQNFGSPYCQKFVDDEPKFSINSQVWLQDVRYCLQEKILEISPRVTCNRLHNEAMHSHVACYVNTGFCELSLIEQYHVYWYLKGALRDPRTWQEAYLLNRACANKNPTSYPIEFFEAVERL